LDEKISDVPRAQREYWAAQLLYAQQLASQKSDKGNLTADQFALMHGDASVIPKVPEKYPKNGKFSPALCLENVAFAS